MSSLLKNAEAILETAEFSGSGPVTILLRGGRPVQILQANDWSLDALISEHCVDEAYRVRRTNGRLQVEGRSASQRCLLMSESAGNAWRRLLPASPVTTSWPVPASF